MTVLCVRSLQALLLLLRLLSSFTALMAKLKTTDKGRYFVGFDWSWANGSGRQMLGTTSATLALRPFWHRLGSLLVELCNRRADPWYV